MAKKKPTKRNTTRKKLHKPKKTVKRPHKKKDAPNLSSLVDKKVRECVVREITASKSRKNLTKREKQLLFARCLRQPR